jgi:hypothetical protein
MERVSAVFSFALLLIGVCAIGWALGDCISRPASAGVRNGIGDSASRMADALERIANAMEKGKL